MKLIHIITASLMLFASAACRKEPLAPGQIENNHQVIFKHYASKVPLVGVKVDVITSGWDLNNILGYDYVYDRMVTDDRGMIWFNEKGSFTYRAISDTMRGPFNAPGASQGVIKNGVMTCYLYPFTIARFYHASGDYMSVKMSANPKGDIPDYPIGFGQQQTIRSEYLNTSDSLATAGLPLLTHQPNLIHMEVALYDGTIAIKDTVITPQDFAPINIRIPY